METPDMKPFVCRGHCGRPGKPDGFTAAFRSQVRGFSGMRPAFYAGRLSGDSRNAGQLLSADGCGIGDTYAFPAQPHTFIRVITISFTAGIPTVPNFLGS